MDPQPPTAWLWLWSGGEGFKNITSNHKKSAKLLNGFEYKSVAQLQCQTCRKSLETVLCRDVKVAH